MGVRASSPEEGLLVLFLNGGIYQVAKMGKGIADRRRKCSKAQSYKTVCSSQGTSVTKNCWSLRSLRSWVDSPYAGHPWAEERDNWMHATIGHLCGKIWRQWEKLGVSDNFLSEILEFPLELIHLGLALALFHIPLSANIPRKTFIIASLFIINCAWPCTSYCTVSTS